MSSTMPNSLDAGAKPAMTTLVQRHHIVLTRAEVTLPRAAVNLPPQQSGTQAPTRVLPL